MAKHTEIKLRRTKLDINTEDTETKQALNKDSLVFGEAFYAQEPDGSSSKKRYFLVGDGASDSKITELPRVRLSEKSISDKITYHDGSALKDLDNNQVYPATTASNVTSTYKSNVEAALTDLSNRTKNIGTDGKYYAASDVDGGAALKVKTASNTTETTIYVTGVSSADLTSLKYNASVSIDASKGILKGAAWNDFAEYRPIKGMAEAGHCVVENGDGSLSRSTKRLQPGASIISDTYGMVIGKQERNAKPLAVAGRVLAYADSSDTFHVGDAVCSDDFGLVSKMSRLEIILHPDAIIGYVSEIPDYIFWNDVLVHNRIWIKLK